MLRSSCLAASVCQHSFVTLHVLVSCISTYGTMVSTHAVSLVGIAATSTVEYCILRRLTQFACCAIRAGTCINSLAVAGLTPALLQAAPYM
jgi:hypothetical protein